MGEGEDYLSDLLLVSILLGPPARFAIKGDYDESMDGKGRGQANGREVIEPTQANLIEQLVTEARKKSIKNPGTQRD